MEIQRIQEAVAAHYGIPIAMMRAQKRRRDVCWPRMVAMYLCREMTEESYPVIGRAFERHHTTVMNGVERMSDIILLNKQIASDIHRLIEKLDPATQYAVSSESKISPVKI